jgi:anti-sigma B factor antagonist
MKLEVEQLEDGLTKVNLFGRMDIAGVDEIAMRFTGLTAVDRRKVVVDLTGVDFMVSIGIRLILQNARALKLRGGSMAVMGPSEFVAQVLDSAGVGNVVPVVPDLARARSTLAAQ